MGNEPPSLSLPSAPYRGIEPFRFVDQPIFSARRDEVRKLVRLITIYRGIFFYGESGAGKSSLINAGLIPALRDEGFAPERVRVQPIAGQELVIERIALTDEGTPPFLPSRFAASADKKDPNLHASSYRLRSSFAALEKRRCHKDRMPLQLQAPCPF